MQSDRAGIVLTEHDAIEPTLGRGAQREEVDVTVTGAHRKVVVEHTAELRAQRFRTRAVGFAPRWIRQVGILLQCRPEVAGERECGRRTSRRYAGRG